MSSDEKLQVLRQRIGEILQKRATGHIPQEIYEDLLKAYEESL